MEIAGIEIPDRLEFGNPEHIKIRKQVEKALELLNEGAPCGICGSTAFSVLSKVKGALLWSCDICGSEWFTNLKGE